MQNTSTPPRPFAVVRERLHQIPAALSLLLCFLFLIPAAFAQRDSGTISGTVQDQGHAVIPNANITLENTTTGEKRTITSNSAGFFNLAAVPVGTYKLTITANGFNTYVATDIVMHAGEDHLIPDIALSVAGAQTQVEVTASEAAVIPTDSGVSSTTINQDLVE